MFVYLYLAAGFALGFLIHPLALIIWFGAPFALAGGTVTRT